MTNVSNEKCRVDPKTITTRIVQTPDDFAMAMAIRAAVFLAEEDNITYRDEFGGNDFAATHILACVDGDPAGVIRCRWFADFVVLERVGIRRRYRSFQVFQALARAAIDLARKKGYHMVTGRPRLESAILWRRLRGNPSGPSIRMYRGTLQPMIIPVAVKNGDERISSEFLGDSDFEDMIAQQEGNWDFGLLRKSLGRRVLAAE